MEQEKRAPMWQRVVAGLLAAAVIWAMVSRWLDHGFEGGDRLLPTLLALYGMYAFGHVAVLGRLPRSLTSMGRKKPRDRDGTS